MSEIATGSATHPPQNHKKTRTIAQRIAGFIVVAIAATAFVVPIAKAIGVDDKYSLISPSGIAFSDFRGYEDWAVVSTAKTDVLKAIVADPAMIKAYKTGVPGAVRLSRRAPGSSRSSGRRRRARRRPSSSMCPTSWPRSSSWKKTARGLRKTAAGGDTRSSTTKPHRASSRPIPRASQTAETLAIRP